MFIKFSLLALLLRYQSIYQDYSDLAKTQMF